MVVWKIMQFTNAALGSIGNLQGLITNRDNRQGWRVFINKVKTWRKRNSTKGKISKGKTN
jgi:hypothetical protein